MAQLRKIETLVIEMRADGRQLDRAGEQAIVVNLPMNQDLVAPAQDLMRVQLLDFDPCRPDEEVEFGLKDALRLLKDLDVDMLAATGLERPRGAEGLGAGLRQQLALSY